MRGELAAACARRPSSTSTEQERREQGAEVDVPGDFADRRFSSQADAESWVGEIWSDLAELGVDAVTLMEADRVVYGPMSLHA